MTFKRKQSAGKLLLGGIGTKVCEIDEFNHLHLLEEQEQSRKVPIVQAIDFLEHRIDSIDKVREWASHMGYKNVSYFSDLFRNQFNERPSKTMDKLKLSEAIRLLRMIPKLKCYSVAQRIGKKDEHALNSFFNRVTSSPPSSFRIE